MVSFTVVILNAALAVLSDKGLCVCVCVGGGGGVGSCDPQDPPPLDPAMKSNVVYILNMRGSIPPCT